MSFLSNLFRPAQQKRSHPSNPEAWLMNMFGRGAETAAGVNVTPENALAVTAVWACVRILSETVASLPLPLYERLPSGGKARAVNHPLYSILHDAPNPEMTSFEYREVTMVHLATWGNAYSDIEMNNAGRPMALWPLRPDRMEVRRGDDGQLTYTYMLKSGEKRPLDPARVLHLRGMGNNGIVGYSPIAVARQAIGLAVAAEEFGARFFGNDARPGGVLHHPGVLGDEAYNRLKTNWESRHQGLDKSHRIAILEEGITFKEIGIPPEDAQFLETRRFQIAEIARMYRIPPHMLADLANATFSNIEHQSIEFVVHTVRPWLVRMEQRFSQSLLMPKERSRYFAEFLVDGLLRGDIMSRYQAYAVGRQNGWLNADDIRDLENMNPLPGGQGEMYLIPLNMVPATAVMDGNGGRQAARPQLESRELRANQTAAMRQRLQKTHLRLFTDTSNRIVKREVNDIKAASKRFLINHGNVAGFSQWIDQFYNDHKAFTARQMLPIITTYGELVMADAAQEVSFDGVDNGRAEGFMNAYTNTFADRHAARGQKWLTEILQGESRATAEMVALNQQIDEELDHWMDVLPGDMAQEESVRSNNAFAKFIYGLAGIAALRWVTFGNTCAYCRHLGGRQVGMSDYFLLAGSEFMPEGATVVLRPSRNIGHPPAHRGCDCMAIAGF